MDIGRRNSLAKFGLGLGAMVGSSAYIAKRQSDYTEASVARLHQAVKSELTDEQKEKFKAVFQQMNSELDEAVRSGAITGLLDALMISGGIVVGTYQLTKNNDPSKAVRLMSDTKQSDSQFMRRSFLRNLTGSAALGLIVGPLLTWNNDGQSVASLEREIEKATNALDKIDLSKRIIDQEEARPFLALMFSGLCAIALSFGSSAAEFTKFLNLRNLAEIRLNIRDSGKDGCEFFGVESFNQVRHYIHGELEVEGQLFRVIVSREDEYGDNHLKADLELVYTDGKLQVVQEPRNSIWDQGAPKRVGMPIINDGDKVTITVLEPVQK